MINYCTYDNFLHFGIFFTFVLLFVKKLEWTEVVYGPFVYGQLMVGQRTLKTAKKLQKVPKKLQVFFFHWEFTDILVNRIYYG